jgi:light-harvesting complex II chlorophyll a/b binding protein 6
MALASTSATAAVLKTPFLGARSALANAASVAGKPAPRRALVVEAKKSWIPAVQIDIEIINPPWLDGS